MSHEPGGMMPLAGASRDATSAVGDRSGRMPVLFLAHGSPMNAIEDNRWSRGLAALGKQLPEPRAILVISAHWYVPGTYLTSNEQPKTIHDFYGFPKALFDVRYEAPGDPALAKRVQSLLAHHGAKLSEQWGLDHGTWSVLRWVFPDARIRVVQLSIDRRLDARQHYHLARSLAPLRSEGVLLVGSGNIVHNLSHAIAQMHTTAATTPDWAAQFDESVKRALLEHDHETLMTLQERSPAGAKAHPSPEHYLPLLYSLAPTAREDSVQFPVEGFDLGSLSMRSVLWG